ncbi:MAG: hypothetical protein H7210_02055 [Pyrinomonadaceae bacterium]|nr:hypothetical protein [Phycisphaerales bacterium]
MATPKSQHHPSPAQATCAVCGQAIMQRDSWCVTRDNAGKGHMRCVYPETYATDGSVTAKARIEPVSIDPGAVPAVVPPMAEASRGETPAPPPVEEQRMIQASPPVQPSPKPRGSIKGVLKGIGLILLGFILAVMNNNTTEMKTTPIRRERDIYPGQATTKTEIVGYDNAWVKKPPDTGGRLLTLGLTGWGISMIVLNVFRMSRLSSPPSQSL